jgi:hypothetical protein
MMAPRLPKLRGHFAEFLRWTSLVLVALLRQFTSVGLSTVVVAAPLSCQRATPGWV